MRKIAIIGMGVTGVSVLKSMAKYPYYQDCKIVVYNPPRTFGTGIPYQEDSEKLLINQTADTMSLEIEDSANFVKWVKKEKGILNGEKNFFPRVWFGEYLRGKLSKAIQSLQPEVIPENVISLRIKKDGTYLIETHSSMKSYDSVHLCIGHLPYKDPYHLIANEGYIHHPYPAQEKLTKFPQGSRIGIIGTGLTSIDLMRFLKSQQKNFQISFFSRKNHFPLYRGFEPDISLSYLTIDNIRQEKLKHHGFVPLEKMVNWFYLECEEKGIDFNDIKNRFGNGTKEQLNRLLHEDNNIGMLQAIIHKMDSHLAEYMTALTESDRNLFFTHYESVFKYFRTPMPKESLEELIKEWNSGRIKVFEGMQTVEPTVGGFKVQLSDVESEEVDYLINATGHEMNVQNFKNNSKLMNQLLNERILQAETFGGVQVIWPSAQAVSQRYGVLHGLYVHGQLVQGIQYGNNAHLLMRQANQVIEKDIKINNKNINEISSIPDNL